MSPDNPEVVVIKKGEVFARWKLAAGEYRLGRASRNELKLVHRGVSRDHARISVVAGEVFIEDLGSRYGTTFDGKPIAGRHPLKPGTQVRIGELSVEVRRSASPPALDLPQATAPPQNQPAPRAVKAQPPRRFKPAIKSPAPSLAQRAIPVVLHIALAAAVVAIVTHLVREREAAANDRAAAQAERVRAEKALATVLRPTPAPVAPKAPDPVAEPSTIPNFSTQLRPFTIQQKWSSDRVRRLEDGSLRINLSTLQIADLSPLRGLPVTELDLSNCQLRALPDLSFLTLRRLSIRDTAITDLTPLSAQPLKELQLDGTPTTNLSPLIGMALESLTLDERVSDLNALRGLPLRELDLRNHTNIRDFRPLLECRRLDIVYVAENADIDCLREHPSLKFIAIRTPKSPKAGAVDGPTPVYYFWEKYGALMRQRAAKSSTDPSTR